MLTVLEKNQLHPPYRNLNIKDHAVLAEFFGGKDKNSLNMQYSYMTRKLLEFGILIKTSDYFIPQIRSKRYSIDNEAFLKYLNEYNILYLHIYKNKVEEKEVRNLDCLKDLVKFGRLRIDKSFTNEEIKAAIEKAYPQIAYYRSIVEELNKTTCTASNAIKFEESIKRSRSGNITKIGIRATQWLSCFPSINKEHIKKYSDGEFRENILRKNWSNYDEYDVKGSVPRIARFINLNEWEDLSVDSYERIFSNFDFTKLGLNSGWTEYNRQKAKELFMLLYFGGSEKEIIKSIKDRGLFVGIDLIEPVKELKYYVMSYCGSSAKKDTSIFLHESCIYLEVMAELAKRNIKVLQVYDGFYFPKGQMPLDMDNIVYESVRRYYSKFFTGA